jgi:hypothetical protein
LANGKYQVLALLKLVRLGQRTPKRLDTFTVPWEGASSGPYPPAKNMHLYSSTVNVSAEMRDFVAAKCDGVHQSRLWAVLAFNC